MAAWMQLGEQVTGVGIDRLEHADWLPWLVLAAVIPLLLAPRKRAAAIAWPGVNEARRAGGRRIEALPWLAAALRCLCLLCLAVALAGPTTLRRLPPESGFGLDLILVLDTSGSMGALDTRLAGEHEGTLTPPAGERHTRLDLARQAVARFTSSRVSEGDRVGLVVFGDSAFTQCPLTSDGGLLAAALERVGLGMAGEATALGDALALAVKRASAAGDETKRVIVLLTDGRSNAGDVPVSIASELAAAAGVRVHTVGIGEGGAEVAVRDRVEAGSGLRFERHDPDPTTLGQIARATGGRFFEARRSADLLAVYDEIDALERSQRRLPARIAESPRPEPLLAAAGGLLLLEIALARLLRRRLP